MVDENTTSAEEPPRPTSMLRHVMRRPGMWVAATMVYAGMGMIALGETGIRPGEFLDRYGWTSIGAVVATLAFVYMFADMFQTTRERFVDVDNRRRGSDRETIAALRREIQGIKSTTPDIDDEKIEAIVRQSLKSAKLPPEETVKSFSTFFLVLSQTLEEKSEDADRKASLLLDKGTMYSKGGILFFIVSIVVWQVLGWIKGFEEQFIYGIASCSILFVFIEFLSAWFLRQYRQFTDTSTYLIKVKSIFDRYMLAYLCAQEMDSPKEVVANRVLELLKDEIRWPETYLLKGGDLSFAKEAVDAMTHFAKNWKDAAKKSDAP